MEKAKQDRYCKWLNERYGLSEQYCYIMNFTDSRILDECTEPEQLKILNKIWSSSKDIKEEFLKEEKKESFAIVENELNQLIKKTRLNIKYDTNCSLCAVNNQIVNAGIFFCNWNYLDVQEYFNNLGEIFVFDPETITKHKKHIVATSEALVNKLDKVETILKGVTEIGKIDVNNIEILQSRINLLTTILTELERGGMVWTDQYMELNRLLMQFIDVKNKITSGEKINLSINYKRIEDILNVNAEEVEETEVIELKEIN